MTEPCCHVAAHTCRHVPAHALLCRCRWCYDCRTWLDVCLRHPERHNLDSALRWIASLNPEDSADPSLLEDIQAALGGAA